MGGGGQPVGGGNAQQPFTASHGVAPITQPGQVRAQSQPPVNNVFGQLFSIFGGGGGYRPTWFNMPSQSQVASTQSAPQVSKRQNADGSWESFDPNTGQTIAALGADPGPVAPQANSRQRVPQINYASLFPQTPVQPLFSPSAGLVPSYQDYVARQAAARKAQLDQLIARQAALRQATAQPTPPPAAAVAPPVAAPARPGGQFIEGSVLDQFGTGGTG